MQACAAGLSHRALLVKDSQADLHAHDHGYYIYLLLVNPVTLCGQRAQQSLAPECRTKKAGAAEERERSGSRDLLARLPREIDTLLIRKNVTAQIACCRPSSVEAVDIPSRPHPHFPQCARLHAGCNLAPALMLAKWLWITVNLHRL